MIVSSSSLYYRTEKRKLTNLDLGKGSIGLSLCTLVVLLVRLEETNGMSETNHVLISQAQGSFYCCRISAIYTMVFLQRSSFLQEWCRSIGVRSSLELTSISNPASLLAGNPLLYEAENDRSKTEKIEEDVLSIGCDIEWDLSREQRLRLSFVFEEVKRSLERGYEAVEGWVRASGCEYWIPYPCFFESVTG